MRELRYRTDVLDGSSTGVRDRERAEGREALDTGERVRGGSEEQVGEHGCFDEVEVGNTVRSTGQSQVGQALAPDGP